MITPNRSRNLILAMVSSAMQCHGHFSYKVMSQFLVSICSSLFCTSYMTVTFSCGQACIFQSDQSNYLYVCFIYFSRLFAPAKMSVKQVGIENLYQIKIGMGVVGSCPISYVTTLL